MLAQICHFLAVDSSNFPQNENIIIGDRSHEGVHLIHYFLNLCLKQNRPVCFVGFSQSFYHYNSIAQKLGTNLLSAQNDNKNLLFIEALKLFKEFIPPSDSSTSENDYLLELLNGNILPFINKINESFQDLAQRKLSSTPVVIIDDLSTLLSAGFSNESVNLLVYQIHQLVSSWGGSSVCFLQVDDEDSEKVWAFASHQSTLNIEVSDLKTGYCKDVHGQMAVQWRDSTTSPRQPTTKISQFKVTDKTVHLFAAGLSTAVL